MTTGRINQIAIHVFQTPQPFKAGLSRIRPGLQRFRTFLPKGVFHIHSLGRGERTTYVMTTGGPSSLACLWPRGWISKLSLRSTRAERHALIVDRSLCLWGAQLLTERHSGTIDTSYHRSCDRWLSRLVFLVNSQSWPLHAQSELAGMPALLCEEKPAPGRVRSYAAGSDG